jgi:hypothetical protein
MSNSLGTLSSSLILQTSLSLAFTMRPELKLIAKDFSAQQVKFGQSVISRISSIPSVTDFTANATSDFNTVDVPVTINQFKRIKVKFEASQYMATSRNLIEEAAKPVAVALSNYIVDQAATQITAGNFSNATVAASPDYSSLVEMDGALVGRGIHGDKFLIANNAAYMALLQDPLVTRPNIHRAPGDEVIATGNIGGVAGFGYVGRYPALPTTGNLIGFAGTNEAIVCASRLPDDPTTLMKGLPFGGRIEAITDPATGFAVLAVEYIDAESLAINTYLAFQFGVAVGNAAAGQRLVSA